MSDLIQPPFLKFLETDAAKGGLETDDVLAALLPLMKQVLAGISHAHKAGIIHRDIKPENILIHERAKTAGYGAAGVVKVTDFGLGKAATISMGQSIDEVKKAATHVSPGDLDHEGFARAVEEFILA